MRRRSTFLATALWAACLSTLPGACLSSFPAETGSQATGLWSVWPSSDESSSGDSDETAVTTTVVSTTTVLTLVEEGTEYLGNTIEWVVAEDAKQCQGKCEEFVGCLAFTWYTTTADCFLKGARPTSRITKVHRDDAVAGIVPRGRKRLIIRTSEKGTSLYCFSLIRLGSYEEEMIMMEWQAGASIFDCDEYDVLSNQGRELVPWVWTSVVDSDLQCKMGGEFQTALNNDIFLVVWDTIIGEGRYLNHDWTIKVDADAVFLPDRLRRHVSKYTDPEEGMYLINCQYGLHGPLEIFSKNTVMRWAAGRKQCTDFFSKLCSGDCFWGEDMFIDQCLKRVLHAQRVQADSDTLLVEDHCDPPSDWESCQNARAVSFHPFKDPTSYLECLNSARFAESYEWTSFTNSSMAGLTEGHFMTKEGEPRPPRPPGSDANLTAWKHYAEQHGFTAFEIAPDEKWGFDVLYKSAAHPLTASLEMHAKDGHTSWIFGPTKGQLDAAVANGQEKLKEILASAKQEIEFLSERSFSSPKEKIQNVKDEMKRRAEGVQREKLTRMNYTNGTANGTAYGNASGTADGAEDASLPLAEDGLPEAAVPEEEPPSQATVEEQAYKRVHGQSGEEAAPMSDGQASGCPFAVEPVYEFWNKEDKDHTYHFEPPWRGETKGRVAFRAFREQAPGTLPVYSFWNAEDSEYTFHMAEALYGEERREIQFYVWTQPNGTAVEVKSYWDEERKDSTLYAGMPPHFKGAEGTLFYAVDADYTSLPKDCTPVFSMELKEALPSTALRAALRSPKGASLGVPVALALASMGVLAAAVKAARGRAAQASAQAIADGGVLMDGEWDPWRPGSAPPGFERI